MNRAYTDKTESNYTPLRRYNQTMLYNENMQHKYLTTVLEKSYVTYLLSTYMHVNLDLIVIRKVLLKDLSNRRSLKYNSSYALGYNSNYDL